MSEKQKPGRKLRFETPEEFEKAVNEYFENCPNKKKFLTGPKHDRKTVELPIFTITGLALHLGFESRQSFYDYEKRDEFEYTVRRARLFIENEYEMQLQTGNVAGAIFALKNMGWIDRKDITTNGESMNPPVSKDEIERAKNDLNDQI